ncbi:FliI/YscN family ATPase [Myxococcota bacterium]
MDLDPEATDTDDSSDAPIIDLSRYIDAIDETEAIHVRGRVTEVTGLVIKATVPGVRIGEMCYIVTGQGERIICEALGFRDDQVMLMPLGEAHGVGPDCEVLPSGRPFSIRCGWSLLGRVVDGLGRPIDGGEDLEELADLQNWAVERPAPDPMKRMRVTEHLAMGVRAIDGLLTVGLGQRIGLFSGSGVGKSTLLGQLARNTEAEIVVTCLVGERGREVRDFIEESLGEEGLKKSVVVVATSAQPSLVRAKCPWVATAIAEWFRDQGKKVVLLMDSATRFARAQREIGLAIGEPPARQGFPPSVFALIPRLMERTGNNETGSITAIYTILVQAGDMEEPIADEVRAILDGHIVLNRSLASRNHWPAIDVLPSLSRVMSDIAADEHKGAAGKLREVLATYEKQRDLILLGAYQYGTDPKTDYAIDKIEEVETFLKQGVHDCDDFDSTVQQLIDMFADAE